MDLTRSTEVCSRAALPRLFHNLQALRFLAAIAVATFHTEIFYRRAGGTWVLDPLRIGFARIDLFFVISGFVTAHVAGSMTTPKEVGVFLFRRFARIFSNYWPVMFAMIAIFGLFAPETLKNYDLLKGFFLIHAGNKERILAVSWTLTQELLFYLVFGALCLAPRRLLPAIIAGLVLLLVGNQLANPPYKLPILLTPLMLEFLAGAGVRLLIGHLRPRGGFPLFVASIAVLFGCAFLCRQIGVTLFSRALIVGPAAALLVYAAAGLELRSVVARPWFSSLGNYAYSIYLVHWPILVIAGFIIQQQVRAHPWSAELVYGFILLTSVGYAVIHHHYLELPLYKLSTGWLRARRPGVSQVAPAV